MNKREKIIFCVKLLLELVVFVLLILTIIYLTSSDNGIEEQINKTSTEEKIDEAIRIFTSTQGMKLEEVLKNIEGIEEITMIAHNKEYKVKIDGREFMVVKDELGNKEQNKEEGEENGQENKD